MGGVIGKSPIQKYRAGIQVESKKDTASSLQSPAQPGGRKDSLRRSSRRSSREVAGSCASSATDAAPAPGTAAGTAAGTPGIDNSEASTVVRRSRSGSWNHSRHRPSHKGSAKAAAAAAAPSAGLGNSAAAGQDTGATSATGGGGNDGNDGSDGDQGGARFHVVKETQEAVGPGRMRINNYQLRRLLGHGGSGVVREAINNSTGDLCAIKTTRRQIFSGLDGILEPIDLKSKGGALSRTVYREVALLKKLRHENVVRLLEVIDDPRRQTIYMVLELMHGPICTTRPSRLGALSMQLTRRYFRDICRGLAYLHASAVVHRDIKAENCLLTLDRKSVKLCDFGLSHVFMEGGEGERRTTADAGHDHAADARGRHRGKAGTTDPADTADTADTADPTDTAEAKRDDDADDRLWSDAGTVPYQSPEILHCAVRRRRAGYHGKPADIWALGILLFRMAFNRIAFHAPKKPQMKWQIMFKRLDFAMGQDEGDGGDGGDGGGGGRDKGCRGGSGQSLMVWSTHSSSAISTSVSCSSSDGGGRESPTGGAGGAGGAGASSSVWDSDDGDAEWASLRDLLSAMLAKDWRKRPTITQVMEHPWVTKCKTWPFARSEREYPKVDLRSALEPHEIRHAITSLSIANVTSLKLIMRSVSQRARERLRKRAESSADDDDGSGGGDNDGGSGGGSGGASTEGRLEVDGETPEGRPHDADGPSEGEQPGDQPGDAEGDAEGEGASDGGALSRSSASGSQARSRGGSRSGGGSGASSRTNSSRGGRGIRRSISYGALPPQLSTPSFPSADKFSQSSVFSEWGGSAEYSRAKLNRFSEPGSYWQPLSPRTAPMADGGAGKMQSDARAAPPKKHRRSFKKLRGNKGHGKSSKSIMDSY